MEDAAAPPELPQDLLVALYGHLMPVEIAAAARVCSSWRAAADSEALWAALLRRDFPTADEATLAVLLERGRGGRHRCVAREAYRWLAAQWACERCGQAFSDGANSPSACTFHPGILFSGGLMNGEALRYTCCNRRAHRVANGSRDGNGCAAAFHCGGQSAWQRHGAGVRPREQPPGPASDAGPSAGRGGATSSSSASASSCRSASPPSYPGSPARLSPDPLEWHPNQRPGLLELPSRLFHCLLVDGRE